MLKPTSTKPVQSNKTLKPKKPLFWPNWANLSYMVSYYPKLLILQTNAVMIRDVWEPVCKTQLEREMGKFGLGEKKSDGDMEILTWKNINDRRNYT